MDSSTTYRLVRKIGQGSASEVFLARAVLPGGGEGAPVAIKRILPLMASNPVLMKRFARQAKLCLPLAHRNLVRLLDYGTYAERQHLVMEYVEGASLAALRVAATAGGFRLSARLVAFIAREMAEGMAALHAARGEDGAALGLVHRNVSPPNVLISRSGQVKIADFAQVKSLSEAEVTRGPKPRSLYVAPEQLGVEAVDARTDVFLLGIVFLETLVGRRPMEVGEPPKVVKELLRQVVAVDLPLPLLYVAKKAVALEPKDRYPSAREMADALSAAIAEEKLEVGEEDLAKLLALALPASATPPTPELGEEMTLERVEELRPAPPRLAASDVAVTQPHDIPAEAVAPPPAPPEERSAPPSPAASGRLRLGDILLSRKQLTSAQLADALAEAGREGRRLGQILRQRKLVEAEELIKALSSQSGTPFIHDLKLDALAPSPMALALLSRANGERLGAVPMLLRDDVLFVAMLDAHDERALAELRELTRHEVRGVFATEQALERTRDRFYRQARAVARAVASERPRTSTSASVRAAGGDTSETSKLYRRLLLQAMKMLGGTAAGGISLVELSRGLAARLGAGADDVERAGAAGCVLALAAHFQEDARFSRPSREVLRQVLPGIVDPLWDLLDATTGENYPFPDKPAAAAVACAAAFAHVAGSANPPPQATASALTVLRAQSWVPAKPLEALEAELKERAARP